MKCERCGQRDAVVTLREAFPDGTAREQRLCPTCAREHGASNRTPPPANSDASRPSA